MEEELAFEITRSCWEFCSMMKPQQSNKGDAVKTKSRDEDEEEEE